LRLFPVSLHMTVSTIRSGDVHIPEEMLRKYGLSDGARVALEDTQEGIIIHAAKKMRSLSDLAGFLGPESHVVETLLEERRRDRESENGPFGS
jgi:bifunctional DNA-binding transcriptional regulator/antitoxin component of YhaV-PrlF toxin-antitoxin module